MECGNTASGTLSGTSASINWSGSFTYLGISISASYSGESTPPGYSGIPAYQCNIGTGVSHKTRGFDEYQLKYRVKAEIYKKTYACGDYTLSSTSTIAWSYERITHTSCVKE